MNYWAMAPWPNDDSYIFERVWDFDRNHGTIALRWHSNNDPSGASISQIERRLREDGDPDATGAARMVYALYNEIQPGDVMIARRGLRLCVGVGTVTRSGYFDLQKAMDRMKGLPTRHFGANFVDVEWHWTGSAEVPDAFTRSTLAKRPTEKYLRMMIRIPSMSGLRQSA